MRKHRYGYTTATLLGFVCDHCGGMTTLSAWQIEDMPRALARCPSPVSGLFGDHSYLIGKIQGTARRFYGGDVLANARDELARLDDEAANERREGEDAAADMSPAAHHAARWRSLLDEVGGSTDEQDWLDAHRRSSLEYEDVLCGAYGPDADDYWTAECLCWFARALAAHLDNPDVRLAARYCRGIKNAVRPSTAPQDAAVAEVSL